MSRSLFGRLFLTYLLIFLCISLVFGVAVGYYVREMYFAARQAELERLGLELNRVLQRSELGQWAGQVAAAESLYNIRIVVRAVSGRQMEALSEADLERFGEEHLVNDVRDILEGRTVIRRKQYSPFLDTDIIFVGRPLYIDEEIAGIILMFAPLEEVNTTLAFLNRMIAVTATLGSILAAVLIYVVSSRIARPLVELEKAARELAFGDYRGEIRVKGGDEIARLAVAFNWMAGQLQKREEVRREMFTDISHELRAPVTAVRGFLQALREGVVPPGESEQYLELAHKEAVRLSHMIGDLLDLSKLQAGQLVLHRSPVEMSDLLAETVEAMSLQAADKEVRLSGHDGAPGKIVDGDRNRLVQVLVNLVDNALRHTPAGGSVDVLLEEQDGGITVTVRDSGCGIPAGDLPYIFEKFYRVDRSREAASGGSGLGLSIVKKVVEAHGGKVFARSIVGEGSAIGFWLPAAGDKPESGSQNPA